MIYTYDDTIRLLDKKDKDFGIIFNKLKREILGKPFILSQWAASRLYRHRNKTKTRIPKQVRHHRDGNENNDTPKNVIDMTRKIHCLVHSKKCIKYDIKNKCFLYRCGTCKIIKSEKEFSRDLYNGRDRVASKCKKCKAAWNRRYNEKQKIAKNVSA